ncbi:unnamed protein product [Victoria cruziana]
MRKGLWRPSLLGGRVSTVKKEISPAPPPALPLPSLSSLTFLPDRLPYSSSETPSLQIFLVGLHREGRKVWLLLVPFDRDLSTEKKIGGGHGGGLYYLDVPLELLIHQSISSLGGMVGTSDWDILIYLCHTDSSISEPHPR